MNGMQLCEAPPAGAKARFNGCLSIQSGWAKAAKASAQATVEFYTSADCSGTAAFKAGPGTDCSTVAKSRIASTKVGSECLRAYPALPTSAQAAVQACERYKAAGGTAYKIVYADRNCNSEYTIAVVSPQSNCSQLDSLVQSTNGYSSKAAGSKCSDFGDATDFSSVCSQTK